MGRGRRLPDGILGPIKNKPVRLADGTIISPSSSESNDKPSLWRVHFERIDRQRTTWTIVRPPLDDGTPELHAIQPSILVYPGGRLQAVGRTRSGRVFQTWSEDGGKTWARQLTTLPNPSSGTDAVTLRDGRHCRLQPHAERPHPAERRGLARRHDVGGGARSRERAGRVLLSGGDPDGRRQGARHLHLEAAARQARRGRSREADVSGDDGRRVAARDRSSPGDRAMVRESRLAHTLTRESRSSRCHDEHDVSF